MSNRAALMSWAALGLALMIGGWSTLWSSTAEESRPRVAPEKLLPAGTVLFVQGDGSILHADAWKKTAAYEAIHKTGLAEVFEKALNFVQRAGGVDNEVLRTMEHLYGHGLTIGVSLPGRDGPSIPQVTVVFHDAAKAQEVLTRFAKRSAGNALRFETVTLRERKVTRAGLPAPGTEVAWWNEGPHLVLVAGMNAADSAMRVADGGAANVTSDDLWKAANQKVDFESTATAWLDAKRLTTAFGQMPVPIEDAPPHTVNDYVQAVGLDSLDSIIYRTGFRGRELASTVNVKTNGKPTGMLASLASSQEITWSDLPPLPAAMHNFHAGSLNATRFYDETIAMIKRMAALGPQETQDIVADVLESMPGAIGIDLKADLLDGLGDAYCAYADPEQSFLGTSAGLAVAVKDSAKVRKSLKKMFARVAEQVSSEQGSDLQIHTVKKHGREVFTFQLGRSLELGALVVDENWLVAAFLPQTVEAFLLRVDGKLPKWSRKSLQEEIPGTLPEKFRSIAVNDPRESYKLLLKAAPVGLLVGVATLKEERVIPRDAVLPIRAIDFPPAELVAAPLFPNVTVARQTKDGVAWNSSNSMPALPILGGIGNGDTATMAPVIAGLLLPAVQQARAAARRAESKNNLKQLGLAMHNYHDAYKAFPAGTVPNEKLKPKDRLSWTTSILPFIEQTALHDKLDKEGGWKDDPNEELMKLRIKTYQNPAFPTSSDGYGQMHYVGIGGLGEDGPTLPANHKRAGIFAYNRKTQIRNITDGTSNTMMISEASQKFGAWGAGGNATIRSFTKKRYINGPDGIGGPFPGGCNVGFADGSVRFISENIDSKTLEALATMAGGEVVGAF